MEFYRKTLLDFWELLLQEGTFQWLYVHCVINETNYYTQCGVIIT